MYPTHTPSYWPYVAVLHFAVFVPAAVHILLHKDDERAATGWLGLVILSPFFGSVLYWMFGINRIRRKARRELPGGMKSKTFAQRDIAVPQGVPEQWMVPMQMGLNVDATEYLAGNSVRPLVNGDEAYPAMLQAIATARQTVFLCSYIFDYDISGRQFVDALAAARDRGVDVYVLLDGYPLGWRWRVTNRALRKRGVATARYLSSNLRFINLRNHRKILAVDGRVAFLGGINIRHANVLRDHPRRPVQDIHFEINGGAVGQICAAFADDWNAATGGKPDFPTDASGAKGDVTARVLLDGPDWNYQKLEWTLLGAINNARQSVSVMTPYMMPDDVLRHAIEAAALRGVDVKIIIPVRSNIPCFDWAMQANIARFLKYGAGVYKTPAPFDHSKIFLIDDYWSFIGSANWDVRSLALNFEINLECYDNGLNAALRQYFDAKLSAAHKVTEADFDGQTLPQRVRNNFFRLFSPYL